MCSRWRNAPPGGTISARAAASSAGRVASCGLSGRGAWRGWGGGWSSGYLRQRVDQSMETGALRRGHGDERLPFEIGDRGSGVFRYGPAGRGERDQERAAVGWVQLPHDVPAPGQPVEQAGQSAGPGGGGRGTRGGGAGRAVGEGGPAGDYGCGQVPGGTSGRDAGGGEER